MLKSVLRRGATIAALATATLANAQTVPPAPAPAEAAKPMAPAPAAPKVEVRDVDPALWVVKDADTTIYMFGTVHVLKPGLGWFDDGVKAAFDASQEVVLEVDLPDDPAAMQQKIMPLIMDMDGPPLTQRLPAASRPKYAAALTSAGLPAGAFDMFHPWFVSTALAVLPLGKLGYDPASGAEKQIQTAAKAAGKPIVSLETVEQQMGFLSSPPAEQQMKMLVKAIDEFDEAGPTLDKMVADWGAGRPDALAAEMNEQMKDFPEVEKALLTDRNSNWADWIKTRLAKPGTVFMAVGAGHLAGKGSVQDMLAARQLKATRVNY